MPALAAVKGIGAGALGEAVFLVIDLHVSESGV
jgi:hypothetical protein